MMQIYKKSRYVQRKLAYFCIYSYHYLYNLSLDGMKLPWRMQFGAKVMDSSRIYNIIR